MSYHNISFQMTIQCQNLCLGVGITRSKVVFFRSAAWSRLRSKTAFDVLNIVHLTFVAHAWRAWIPSIHQVPWSGASFYWFLAIDSHGQPGSRHAQTSINRFTYIKANYLMTGITGETGSDMMHLISIPSCTEFIPADSIQPWKIWKGAWTRQSSQN